MCNNYYCLDSYNSYIIIIIVVHVCVLLVNICPEDGKVDRNCFNRAQAFVYGALEGR